MTKASSYRRLTDGNGSDSLNQSLPDVYRNRNLVERLLSHKWQLRPASYQGTIVVTFDSLLAMSKVRIVGTSEFMCLRLVDLCQPLVQPFRGCRYHSMH